MEQKLTAGKSTRVEKAIKKYLILFVEELQHARRSFDLLKDYRNSSQCRPSPDKSTCSESIKVDDLIKKAC